MIYKLDKGGIVKLQNAWTTMPSVEDAILRAWTNQSAKEKAEKQVASEKPKYTYVNPYDYLHGWREATEDAAKQDKYTVENLGGSKEEAEAAYNASKENAAKQLAGTTATGLGTVALLGLSGGAAGPVAADIINTGFGAHGIYNALSGNGIQKTVRLANQGDTWGAVKSGAGDLLDLSMGLHAAKLWGNLGKSMLAGQSLGNAYRGNIAGREMSNLARKATTYSTPVELNNTISFTPRLRFTNTVHFDPRVKPLSRSINEAERLGIPKAMRSNPKSLEDPYYWGYKQWNQRYNSAVNSGNLKEAQRLRALHFITKAPNTKVIEATEMPKEVYHGSQQKFTVFDSSKTRPDYNYGTSTNMFSDNKNVALGYANNDPDKLHSVYLNLQNILERDFKGNPWNGSVNNSGKFQIVPEYGTIYSSKQEAEAALQKILDQYYPNNPAKQAEQRHYMYVFELMDPPHPERSTNAFSDEIAKSSVLDGGIVRNVQDYYDLPKFDENPELYKELTSPHTDYFVKDPRNIKSSAIITYDNFGRIIPIVKRDNFHNPDIRHKQGGILKAQKGTGLAGIPIIGSLARKAAYKIISNPDVGYSGGATPKLIAKSLFSKNEEDDNKKFFLYGVERPYRDIGEAYNWQKDIDENGYKNVKSYEGVLNPYGEYLIDSKNKHLVEDNLGKDLLININSEYTDPNTGFISDSTPYFDDVHGYRLKFHKDENGNIVAFASDLYDFGKNYSDGFSNIFEERSRNKNGKRILEMERNALNAVGQPYILTNKYPVRFIDNPEGEELMRVRNLEGEILNNKKSGGVLNAQKGTPGFVTPMTNQFTTKLMEFLEKYRRKGPAPQKAVGPAVWAYNKPSKIADDGGKIS